MYLKYCSNTVLASHRLLNSDATNRMW
jgi:hypothetical protein